MKKGLTLFFALSIWFFLVASIHAGNPAKSPYVVKLDSIQDKYESVIFDHKKHAGIAGDCGACHHQHGNSGKLPCKDCHSLSPSTFKESVVNNFMACKNCHSSFDRENPKMPSLKVAYHSTCFTCHKGMGSVGLDPKGCTELCHARKTTIGKR